MGQMLIRQLDDAKISRLKIIAKERNTSVEALARDAIHSVADLSVQEKRDLVLRMQARFRAAMIPGAVQTPGVDLIREDRDR